MSRNAQQSVEEKCLRVETFANVRNVDREEFPNFKTGILAEIFEELVETDDHVTRVWFSVNLATEAGLTQS